jgi:drug/metabolite transporter (DMT)-like permease
MPKSKKIKYPVATFLALMLAEVLWGINTPVIKLGLRSVPLPVYLSVTLLGAAILLMPLAKKHWQPMSKPDYALLIVASLIGITLGNVVLLMGLKRVLALNASIINLFKPMLLLLLSVEFLKERFGWRTFWGILIAFAGAAVLIGQPWQSGSNNESMGILLIILAAFCDVIATIMIKPIVSRSNSYQVTSLHLFIGAAPIAVYALYYLPSMSLKTIGKSGVIAIIFNIIAIALANALFYFGLKYRQAQNTGIFQYVNPVATFISAWIILGEGPNERLIAGSILIVIGIYFAEKNAFHKLKLIRLVR